MERRKEARESAGWDARAETRGPRCYRWKVSEGLIATPAGSAPPLGLAKPVELLRHLSGTAEPGIYILLDLHPYLDDPVHARLLKDAAAHGERRMLALI